MLAHIIEDDRELYVEYRRLVADRAESVQVIVNRVEGQVGAEMPELEHAVRELLAAELVKLGDDRLRANGVSEEHLDQRDLPTSLKGTSFPERDQRIVEAKIRQLARQMMWPSQNGGGGRVDGGREGEEGGNAPGRGLPTPDYGVVAQASHSSDHSCICASTWRPGTQQSLSRINPLPSPPAGRDFITIGIELMVNNIWGPTFSGDTLLLRVDPGAAFGVSAGQMQVGLISAVSWAKEIYAYNFCSGRLPGGLSQSGPGSTSFMMLTRGCGGAQTIVFRKPQLGGVWADVGFLDPNLFWTVFDGRRLTFTWLTD